MRKGWITTLYRMRHLFLFGADIVVTSLIYAVSWLAFHEPFGLNADVWWIHWLLVLGCQSIALLLFRCYASLWRYADSKEYLMLFLAMATSWVLYHVVDALLIPGEYKYVSRFTLIIVVLSLVGMWLFRFSWRYLRQLRKLQEYHHRPDARPVVVVGAGDAGVDLVEEIKRNSKVGYHVQGYFDDDPAKQGKMVRDVAVLGTIDEMPQKLANTPIKDIIVAIPSISDEDQRRVLQLCSQTGCRVQILPRVTEWMNKDADGLWSHVRDVKVEDLLGREAITFDNQEVYDFLEDKVVMVTGGGGSIGSELCRQIACHAPRRLIIVDIYENNAYDIQQELRYQYGDRLDLCVEIASVRDRAKVDCLFRRYRPHIVFHAAAHKHVPLMENCPEEAIKNNVFGTYNVAQAAADFSADKFILISTDKAVNPTNVMGASKRMCEMIVQSMEGVGNTCYVAVRFGNVLGSNGSVVPLFKRQLEQGGPLTVTDHRIIRYFMTIPEAAQLVMQAGAMADSSQIFVLDMGEPVKILTLAENLVRLAGYIPYKDIDIIETGLRPGEKLYEELLMDNDRLGATKYNKIFVEQRESLSYDSLLANLESLRQVLETEDKDRIIAVMQELVPTFRTPEEVNAEAVTANAVSE